MSPALVQLVLALHAFSTLAMTGLIWFVQIVHYPLLRLVGAPQFVDYERQHTRRTATVVGPLMLAEASTAVTLLFAPADAAAAALAWTGAALLAIVWLSTAVLQVPCHRRLEAGFSDAACSRLIATNWVRTAAWSARSGVALSMLVLSAAGVP